MSHSFDCKVLKIFPCPASGQIVVVTEDKTLNFIDVMTIAKKKLEVRGRLTYENLSLDKTLCGCEINDEFLMMANGRRCYTIEVNFVKSISEETRCLEDVEEITSICYQGGSIIFGRSNCGVSLVRL